jgi:hypothetical protein
MSGFKTFLQFSVYAILLTCTITGCLKLFSFHTDVYWFSDEYCTPDWKNFDSNCVEFTQVEAVVARVLCP